jgi:predicted HTH transcriptional regulator
MDVIAVITAEGENMISTAEEPAASLPLAAETQPKATKKARVAQQGANVAKKKGKPAKKATPEKKAPKAKKTAKVREGSKTDQVLELLKRPGGVTAQELMKTTGWQPHSVRGFLSGTVRKKMGLSVISTKGEDGERSYSVKS